MSFLTYTVGTVLSSVSFLTYIVGTVLSCVVPYVHCRNSSQLCRSLRTLWAQFSAVSFLTYTVGTVLSSVSFFTYTLWAQFSALCRSLRKLWAQFSAVSFLTLWCSSTHRHHGHHKLPSSSESNFARNDGGVNWDFYSSGEFIRHCLRTSFVFLSLFLFLFGSLGGWGCGVGGRCDDGIIQSYFRHGF